MPEALERLKKKMEKLSDKVGSFICALGGKIEGMSPLPPEQTAALRRRAGFCTAFTVLAFLMASSTSLFGSSPYGLALLYAAGHSNTVFVWLGATAGAIAGGREIIPYLIILALSLGARFALSGDRFGVTDCPLFGEPLKMRLILSTVASLFLELAGLLSDGFSMSALLSIAAGAVITPLMTAVFTFAFDKSVHSALREGSLYLLLYVTISALAGETLPGFSFALIVSFMLILHTGITAGIFRGTLVGLVCGIACGDLGVILAVAGLCAGAFAPFGTGSATFLTAALSIGIAFYSSGGLSLVRITGDIIFASLLFVPLAKAGLLKKIKLFGKSDRSSVWFTDPATEKRAEELRRDKLSKLSKAFDEMSLVFMKLSESMRSPDNRELVGICEQAFDKTCARCPLSGDCWQKNYISTDAHVKEVAKLLSENGGLAYTQLPDDFRRRCRRADRIVREINDGYANYVESVLTKDKSELFALDYAAVAELLKEESVDRDRSGDYQPDDELSKTASGLFRSLGMVFSGIGAWGTRRKSITVSGLDIGSVTVSSRQISDALSKATGKRFGEPDFSFEGDFVSMRLTSLPIYRVGAAVSFQPRSGEEASGDCVRTFHTDSGMVYALICDGMGSGREAATVADLAATFLEKMISAGNTTALSLQLLSNFLCSRAAECHTTVDLAEIDLYTGRILFTKCGAAPSYVFRTGKIFKVDSQSMPIGIMKDICSEETALDSQAGDIAVLASDGVGATFEQTLWLPELVNSGKNMPPSELADAIRARAVVENRGADDVSVAIIRTEKV